MEFMAELIVVGRATSAEEIAKEFSISPRRQAYLRALVTGSSGGASSQGQRRAVRRRAARKKAARKR